MSEDKVKKSVKRVPLHKQNVFTAQNIPGFKTMWVNEYVGEVDKYRLAGWEVVQSTEIKTHDGQVQIESQMDSVVRRVVNRDPNAACKTAVLMKLPIELYEADQKAEQDILDQTEKSWNVLKRGEYGSIDISY